MKTKLKIKQEEGITLIALVVTIVVLLILAGVSISLVLNNNGVISKAKDAKNSTEKGQAQDEVNLAINYLQIEDATSTLTREDRRKILEDELRKISVDSTVSISGDGFKIIHKKYEFFVDEDLNVSDSEKEFDATEWDKKAAPEDIFIWKSDDPNNADYGVVIGYKKNADNYTILRFPSRCTKIATKYSDDLYKDYEDNESIIRSYTKNIMKVEMPDTITELGYGAFSAYSPIGQYSYQYGFYFSSLERVEFSRSLSKIENYAFSGCEKLKYIEISDNITEIGAYAFSECKAIESITIPAGVREISDNCFASCTNLQQVNLPEGVKKIGNYCFNDCRDLQQINLPEGLEEIGNGAFDSCYALKSITIPEGVKEIKEHSFQGCTNLKQINLPEGLEKIGRGSFNLCTSLQQINLPEGLEEIGYYAFHDTSSLSEIIIPESVKTIGKYAFSDWTASQTIKCKATKAGDNWDEYWNYNYANPVSYVTKIKSNIIWGYQDSNT